jgi:hypothetical protein
MKGKRVLTVIFATTKHIPANEVTVSCEESLSSKRPIRGEYTNQKWQYRIPLPSDADKATLCFQVNEDIPMEQEPIVVPIDPVDQPVELNEHNISFPSYKSRYCHGIERLLNEETDFSRRYVPGNLDTTQKYDVIVVGSGMGGGILADQLSDSGVSVLVLEAGAVHLPDHLANSPLTYSAEEIIDKRTSISYEQEQGSQLEKDVHMCLGGRSLYWSAVIPRMNCWDLEHWPDKIVDYLQKDGYTKAERLFRKRTEFNDYEKVLRARLEEELPKYNVSHLPRSYHQETSWITARLGNPDERPTGYFSTAALLLNSVSYPELKTGGKNITINLNHLVTHLEWDRRKVTGVVGEDLINHKQRTYRGKVIVLAAGATESPCIALRSELNDQSKKIGIGLTDHQSAKLDFIIPEKSSIKITPRDQAKLFLLPKLEVGNENQFSCELALNHRFWEPRYYDDDLYEEKLPDNAPIQSTIKFLFRRKLNDSNYIKLPTKPGQIRPTVFVEPMRNRPLGLWTKKVGLRIIYANIISA